MLGNVWESGHRMEWLSGMLMGRPGDENERTRPEQSVEVNWESLLDDMTPEGMSCDNQLIAGKEIFLVDHLLSKEECLRLIDAANQTGFGKTNYPKHYRGNLRLNIWQIVFIFVSFNIFHRPWSKMNQCGV